MDLNTYNRKRDFHKTREPKGEKAKSAAGNRYLIQKHDASHLHYDFRLELDGVLKSWAVPKGPSVNPKDKRLAVMTEDHPLAYGDFEGTIPEGEYGGGTVMLWDTGTWEPEGNAKAALKKGKLTFTLHGERLHGTWHLTRMKPRKGEKRENWLLIKGNDDYCATKGDKLVKQYLTSVVTDRKMQEIANDTDKPEQGFDFTPPEGAKKAAMPDFIPPQLATLENDAPDGDGWIHEIKYDGYRLQLRKEGEAIACLTRRGHNWAERVPALVEALQHLPAKQAIIDGELVVLNAQGVTDFKALQNTLGEGEKHPLQFYAFDLLYCEGYDLRKLPLLDRKAALAKLITGAEQEILHYSDHIQGQGDTVYAKSCTLALEGIISKKADAKYHSGRNRDWLKSKCSKRQEFIIAGYQKPTHSARGVGSLALAYYDGAVLRYAGKVGTGFGNMLGMELREKLDAIPAEAKPVEGKAPKNIIWAQPQLVAEVEFTEWTPTGALRHPSFIGLREDKRAKDVVREQPDDNVDIPSTPLPEFRLTSPDKVLWPTAGVTKQDLAQYYHDIAKWILPYVANRPLSLVRCPEGRDKPCFFQRHQGRGAPDGLNAIGIKEDDGTEAQYLTLADEKGLLAMAQFGALEVHPWGARNDDVEKPDMLIFDLDPAEDVPFQQLKAAAREVKQRLEELGLACFLKTTGGKGLHVQLPLDRRQTWEELKGFAAAFARKMAEDDPDHYIAVSTKAKRKGKIFIDYLRNGRSATAIAPYSTRARENATIAVPLAWDELDALPAPNHYTIANIRRRLGGLKTDPWADYASTRQSLTKAMLRRFA